MKLKRGDIKNSEKSNLTPVLCKEIKYNNTDEGLFSTRKIYFCDEHGKAGSNTRLNKAHTVHGQIWPHG
jgi:hypothetical protein